MPSETACKGCGLIFSSRNKVFKHLNDTDGACLSKEDYVDFCQFVRQLVNEKVMILYGYLPIQNIIRNGSDAATILINAMKQWEQTHIVNNNNNNNNGSSSSTSEENNNNNNNNHNIKYNRSYGNDQRGISIVAQDNDTGAVTEVLSVKLLPLKSKFTVDEFLEGTQQILDQQFSKNDNITVTPIRILGRQSVAHQFQKFNAEMDVSHRRIEYLLPMDFLSWSVRQHDLKTHLEQVPSFSENHKHTLGKHTELPDNARPNEAVKQYLHDLKKLMQQLSTNIVHLDVTDESALLEKEFSLQKRASHRRKNNKTNHTNNNNNKCPKKTKKQRPSDDNTKVETTNDLVTNALEITNHGEGYKLLKRKRFHNFTETVMAHEYLAYRRLDRMYHRACIRYPNNAWHYDKPFLVLSLTGDLFLTGQVLRIVGVFLALANGLLDKEFIDCVFDEAFPRLIPTPPMIPIGMMAGEAYYMTWEGKMKSILSPRNTDRYDKGWNQLSTLQRVKEWQGVLYQEIAKKWLERGLTEDGRLVAEAEWTEQVLKPWADNANDHLQDYRLWKQQQKCNTSSADGCKKSSADANVPEIYKKVLNSLRKIDETGQWPSTTLKRQLVMVSTAKAKTTDGASSSTTTSTTTTIAAKPESLSMAHKKAKNNRETRTCAYAFEEGQGGASGSFSVGYMPGGINKQPKSNQLFPELVQAAFELETKLFPNRASSTIAINRNAQFRPHTDSGAGAGQSTSLIVGLGNYAGGELMVEGAEHDIRYKAIEFNGWTQRHWTMPFKGERYSLVWFTPKGCEGMRGIDLDFSL